jgi:hypothetical protein
MAQTGYTPISIYYSSTASNTPTAGNLVAGELAINTADGKLFYKDSAGVVQVIGTKGGVGSSTTTQVLYNSSGLIVGSANMTFSGTTLTLANDASISGLTVGKGGGSVSNNTAVGVGVLAATATGGGNNGLGWNTLVSVTSGSANDAFGQQTLNKTTTGSYNDAFGYQTLYNNTTGSSNVAFGALALNANTTAGNNVAVGYQAGYSTTGSAANYNVFVGNQAGYSNTSGANNTFVGAANSGFYVTTGSKNTILGAYTGNQGGLDIRTASNYIVLSDGDGNPRVVVNAYGKVLIGQTASLDGAGATAAQLEVTQTGDNDIFYLTNSNATAPYGINIKYSAASPNGSTQNFLYCADSTTSRAYIRSNGGLSNYSANNTNLSDQREKKNIELAGNYLDKICAIPVKTFLYNDQTDEDLNLGVIAQDVQAVAPELVNESNWADKNEPEKLRLSIYQTDLQYALMKAIQELKAEFDAYKATHP